MSQCKAHNGFVVCTDYIGACNEQHVHRKRHAVHASVITLCAHRDVRTRCSMIRSKNYQLRTNRG